MNLSDLDWQLAGTSSAWEEARVADCVFERLSQASLNAEGVAGVFRLGHPYQAFNDNEEAQRYLDQMMKEHVPRIR